MNDPLYASDLYGAMPVRIYRPNVADSEEEILVQIDFPIAHLRACGFEFVRLSRRITRRDGHYVMEGA